MPNRYLKFLLIGLIIAVLAASYRTCAQIPEPYVTGCDLLMIENAINKTERNIDSIYRNIAKNYQVTNVDSFLQLEMPPSIWYFPTRIRKPSSDFSFNNCNQPVKPQYKDILLALKREVEIKLIEANENEEKSRKKGAIILAPMKGKPPGKAESADNRPAPQTVPRIDAGNGESFSCFTRSVLGKDFICAIVPPRSEQYGIDFLWRDKDWRLLGSFGKAIDYLEMQHKKPVMLMNAGIYDEKRAPLGLFYNNGREIRKFNAKKGEGNFYLDPTGVFIIYKNGQAKVLTREAFTANIKDTMNILHATQSGPMLVINGVIHKAFNEDSPNQTIRNGVGILPDGRIVFVLSRVPVNLYEFAQIFRDGFGCKDALYLDGAISKMYLPQLNILPTGGDFAGMIAIYQKK